MKRSSLDCDVLGEVVMKGGQLGRPGRLILIGENFTKVVSDMGNMGIKRSEI